MADDVQQQINGLHTKLSAVELQVSRVEGEVRIVKHDQANMKMGLDGFSSRFDKFQDTISNKIDALKTDISGLNVKQEKGLSFFAGMAATISLAAGFIIMLVKMLFPAAS